MKSYVIEPINGDKDERKETSKCRTSKNFEETG